MGSRQQARLVKALAVVPQSANNSAGSALGGSFFVEHWRQRCLDSRRYFFSAKRTHFSLPGGFRWSSGDAAG